MASPSTLEYGKPVKFYAESSAIPMHFPDFDVVFLKQLRVFSTIDESGPSSIVNVFVMTDSKGKKSELSAVAAAGIRAEGPKFKSNKKSFQLVVAEFNGKSLNKNELVITRVNFLAK